MTPVTRQALKFWTPPLLSHLREKTDEHEIKRS